MHICEYLNDGDFSMRVQMCAFIFPSHRILRIFFQTFRLCLSDLFVADAVLNEDLLLLLTSACREHVSTVAWPLPLMVAHTGHCFTDRNCK